MKLAVSSRGALVGDIAISPGEPWLGFPPEPVLLRDPELDPLVRVYGRPVDVRAMMSATARAAVRAIFVIHPWRALVLRGNKIEILGPLAPDISGTALDDVRLHLARLAEDARLDRGSLLERLRRNAGDDPNPAVRRANFEELLVALEKSTARQRSDVLFRLLESEQLDDELRARTLRTLGEQGLDDRLKDALLDEAGHGSTQVLAVAIEVATRHREAALLPRLDDLSQTDDAVGVAMAGALAAFASDTAQPGLHELLRHRSKRVRIAAMAALAEVGTLDAIEPLHSAKGGLFGDVEEKRAAKRAIAAIQSRRGAKLDGAVSLAGDDRRGALSGAEAGRLSVDDE